MSFLLPSLDLDDYQRHQNTSIHTGDRNSHLSVSELNEIHQDHLGNVFIRCIEHHLKKDLMIPSGCAASKTIMTCCCMPSSTISVSLSLMGRGSLALGSPQMDYSKHCLVSGWSGERDKRTGGQHPAGLQRIRCMMMTPLSLSFSCSPWSVNSVQSVVAKGLFSDVLVKWLPRCWSVGVYSWELC